MVYDAVWPHFEIPDRPGQDVLGAALLCEVHDTPLKRLFRLACLARPNVNSLPAQFSIDSGAMHAQLQPAVLESECRLI